MFAIPVKTGDVLVFSYLGYKSQEVKIAAQTRLDIKLVPEANIMDEVVVVGYGAVKRGDLTGSVASVSSKDVEGFKTGSVMEALGGQIAGVQITATDGTPGAGFDIKVRGVGSVNGDTSPLYIVDGFQVDNIDYLSNSDIESIEVLKDASSSAIYGSRAANGVVMVTTKSGKVGRPVVTYNGSASYRQISGTLDLLSPYEFVKLQTEAWPDKFGSTYYKAGNDDNGIPYRYQSIEDYRNVKGVDWQNETFRPTWSQDHNVSVSGGNDKTKYAFSFADFLENGIFKNSAFNKITAKVRVSHKISKAVTIETTVNYANTDKRGVGTSGDNGRFNMLAQILRARRFDRGAMNISSNESKFVIENGRIKDILPRPTGESERMIEEFMLTANQAAATLAMEQELPFIYRVHEQPPVIKVNLLHDLLTRLNLPAQRLLENPQPKDFSDILEGVRGTELEPAINGQLLRTMSKAIYSEKNIGHFGLVLDNYAHFTSPIRRYPDLAIHRILSSYLAGSPKEKLKKRYGSFVPAASKNASQMEQNAMNIERDCEDCYKAEYMSGFIGQSFTGRITGVTSFGFFVELENSVEGLVSINDLPVGDYQLEEGIELKDSLSGTFYRIGQPQQVTVASVDVSAGQVNFTLA